MRREFGAVAVATFLTTLHVGAFAQTVQEEAIESRFQLDFVVSSPVLKTFLPAGWELHMATTGPATDCNLRVIFIDRIGVTDQQGRPASTGPSQMVYFTVPVRNTSSRSSAQMVVAGLSSDAKNTP